MSLVVLGNGLVRAIISPLLAVALVFLCALSSSGCSSGSSGHAGPPAVRRSPVTNARDITGSATVHIYSGLRDPSWTLSGPVLTRVLRQLDQLERTPTFRGPGGYYGFDLDLTYKDTETLRHFAIFRGGVQETDYRGHDLQAHQQERLYLGPRKFYQDPHRTLEHTLLASTHLGPRDYALVKSGIEG